MRKLLCLPFLLWYACSGDQELPLAPVLPEEKISDQFARANSMLAQREDEQMDIYARNRKYPFIKTSTGIRHYVYRPSESGDSVIPGMQISMDYTLSLLDGTVCYTSDSLGRRSFVVGHDDVESGLHRGVQYLKRGDRAFLMIPSALAHGLLGDLKKIPPQMPIVYHVHIY